MFLTDSQKSALRTLNRGWFNTVMLRRRHFDGYVASMRRSGTHWLKYMLGLTISRLYDVPPPAYVEDETIVSGTKKPATYAHLPRIVTSHSVPHYLMRSAAVMRTFHFPKYLVLVRHPIEPLVSDYERHKERYGVTFSEYLRAGPKDKRYLNNIWSQIRFMNGWGAVIRNQPPDRAMVVRYEELGADTVGIMARICDFFGIVGADDELLGQVRSAASKSNMARRATPGSNAVRISGRPARDWFSPDDLRYAADVYRSHLKYDFGYSFDP